FYRSTSTLSSLFPYTTLFRSCGGILLILLVNEGTLKEMHRAFTVVDDADDFTVFKAQRGVSPGQTMELLFPELVPPPGKLPLFEDRKSTRLNSSHQIISYAVF